MFLEKVANELLLIKKINVFEKYGKETYDFFNNYIRNTKDNYYFRRIASTRKFADILDVPVKFVIAILKYEGVVEIDKTIETN